MAGQATVPDSQRASNHNYASATDSSEPLFPILKEHQITTERLRGMRLDLLFPILKEHQITTA